MTRANSVLSQFEKFRMLDSPGYRYLAPYLVSTNESELFIKRQRDTRMITPISKDLDNGLFVKRAGLRHLFNTKRWHHGLEGRRFHHKLGRFLATRDTTSSVNESSRLTGLVSRLNSLKYELAKAAQKEYDAWSQDEEGFDWEVGTGGICNQIAEAMADVINDKVHGAHAFTDGSNDMNHTWVFVCNYDYDEIMDLTDEPDDFELVEVDIPYSTYETGGGYNWKKIPNVKFDSSDVEIGKSWTGFSDYKYMLRYESADTKAGALLEQLEMTVGVRVSHNPSNKNAVIRDLKLGVWSTEAPDSPLVERLRWLLDPKSGDLFIWDGYHAIHKDMAGNLGLNYRACVSGFIKVAPNGDWSISKDTLVWDRLDQNDGDATPQELAIVQRAIS